MLCSTTVSSGSFITPCVAHLHALKRETSATSSERTEVKRDRRASQPLFLLLHRLGCRRAVRGRVLRHQHPNHLQAITRSPPPRLPSSLTPRPPVSSRCCSEGCRPTEAHQLKLPSRAPPPLGTHQNLQQRARRPPGRTERSADCTGPLVPLRSLHHLSLYLVSHLHALRPRHPMRASRRGTLRRLARTATPARALRACWNALEHQEVESRTV